MLLSPMWTDCFIPKDWHEIAVDLEIIYPKDSCAWSHLDSLLETVCALVSYIIQWIPSLGYYGFKARLKKLQ